jgi:hypothetical protein
MGIGGEHGDPMAISGIGLQGLSRIALGEESKNGKRSSGWRTAELMRTAHECYTFLCGGMDGGVSRRRFDARNPSADIP